jgi:hypothetical protein
MARLAQDALTAANVFFQEHAAYVVEAALIEAQRQADIEKAMADPVVIDGVTGYPIIDGVPRDPSAI